MTELLHEAVAANPVKKGKRWLVTLAVPGKGSSGTYSPELLENYGPVAFPSGTKAYWGHAAPQDRDARDQLGKYEETFWNAEIQKLQSYLKPYPRWEQVVEEMGSDLELSIFTNGTKDEDGNVLTLEYSRTNSVDAVAFAGLEGSGLAEQVESLAESMGIAVDKTSETVSEEIGSKMTVEEKLDKLTSAFEAFIATQGAKAQESAQVEADQAAAEAAATAAVEAYAGRVEAVNAARESLLPSQYTELLAKAKSGGDVAEAIESAKKVAEEAKTHFTESAGSLGRVMETRTETKYGAWS